MLILAFCIFCNVLLAIIFKWFASYRIDNLNAIIVNYLVCIVTASLFLGESAIPRDLFQRPWFFHALMMASFFIIGLNVLALSFQKCGVALTVIVQKMSLVLPASFCIALYGESLNLAKGIGILLAIGAIVLVNLPSRSKEEKLGRMTWILILLLLLTWLLSGLIEILLFVVGAENLVTDDTIQFTASSFLLAAIMGGAYSIFLNLGRKGAKLGKRELLGGIALGIPNFLTIYLILVLLSKGWEGSVLFPMNNVGILIFTAFAGILFYSEKIGGYRLLGLILATASILFIGFS